MPYQSKMLEKYISHLVYMGNQYILINIYWLLLIDYYSNQQQILNYVCEKEAVSTESRSLKMSCNWLETHITRGSNLLVKGEMQV